MIGVIFFVLLIVLVVAVILSPLALIDRRRRRRRSMLPLLADVGDRSYGTLSCPVCGSTSFETSPEDGRSFFAFAIFFFVFGTLDSGKAKRIECVVCGSLFLRGAPTRAFDGASDFAPR